MNNTALIITGGDFLSVHAKTAHGLVRASQRYTIKGVIADKQAPGDAGEVLDGTANGIPLYATIGHALSALEVKPGYCIVGAATHGGRLTTGLRSLLLEAVKQGISIVNGLHEYAADDPGISKAAHETGAEIIDVRRPKPKAELHFWTGAIAEVTAPRLAVLGTDCALGKRTTAKKLVACLCDCGIKAEMIYTGQTGWIEGAEYGFVLDSVPNDFVSGEIEHAVLSCWKERAPDVLVIEGQSALQNPCGPCGSEILLSAQARGVILQHAPGRTFFEGYEEKELHIPPIAQEKELITLYNAELLGVTLNREGLTPGRLAQEKSKLTEELAVPVIDPFTEIDRLVPVIRTYIDKQRRQ